TADEWLDALHAVTVHCAPILTVGEGIRFSEKLGLQPVVQVGEGTDPVPLIKNPISYSSIQVSYHKSPPSICSDENAVYSWLHSTQPKHAAETRLANAKS